MTEASPPITSDKAPLARLAEMDLALAEKAHALAMAATDADEFNGLARSYQRASRCLRQTLALEAKIERDQALDARRAAETRDEAMSDADLDDREHAWRIEQRLNAVQDAVGRVIAVVGREQPDWQTDLYTRFDRELDDWVIRPQIFMALDVDSLVRDMCARLKLPPDVAATWRTLPPAEWAPDPAEAKRSPAAAPPVPHADTG
jgi:hypothetical protein